MTATVREGIYLEQNPPARSQYRTGRREPIRAVIVVHTAESGTDQDGDDPKAENVANFIRTRSDAGSYHLLGDTDSILHLVHFDNESYSDGTGSNEWAIHISLAMNAADWQPGALTVERRSQLLDTAAQMAVIAGDWLYKNGYGYPKPVLLTKAESDRPDASGFISHALRDPERRTDPGEFFPWPEFLARFAFRSSHTTADRLVADLQAVINDMGWTPTLAEDGVYGPLTSAAVAEYLARVRHASTALGSISERLMSPTPLTDLITRSRV